MTTTDDVNNNIQTKSEFRKLAELGLSVFSLPRGRKESKMSWKQFQIDFPSEEQIASWDEHGQHLNVAIVTGRLSNVIVLDIDGDDGQNLIDSLDLPKTPTVRTSKGQHRYFRYPKADIRNSTRVGGVKLDIRGEGGYAVGPGSVHPDGGSYFWEISPEETDFAELPANVIALLAKPSSKPSATFAANDNSNFAVAGPVSEFVNAEIQEALDTIQNAKEGERNDTLFKATVKVANHIAALGLDWENISQQFEANALSIGLEPAEIKATIASAWKAGQATPTKWLQISSDWIYVASRDLFWSSRTRQSLKPSAFSMNFADAMPGKGKLATYLTSNGYIDRVLDFEFDPTRESGIFERDGGKFYNHYQSPDIESCDGDSRPLMEFLAYLVPCQDERAHLVRMVAYTVRNPGKKLGHALLLQSKEQGIGKTTLVEIWRELLGPKNTRKTNSEEMASDYQSYLADTLLVVTEELSLGSGIQVYNKLKDIITGETAVVNEKYVKQREVRNYANLVFLSNWDAPLLIEQNDRRFFVLESPAKKRDGAYWNEFYKWWKGNLGIIKRYFDDIDLSEFEPNASPPGTPAKERLKLQSETPLVQELRVSLAGYEAPFNGDVFAMDDVKGWLRSHKLRTETTIKLASALREVGCIPLGQHRINRTRESLWAGRNTEKWKAALPADLRQAYFDRNNDLADNDNDESKLGEMS